MRDVAESNIDPRFSQARTLFFVIGGQKCGTTWLHAYFRDHPEVCVPAWKESNYWASVDGRKFLDRLEREVAKRHGSVKLAIQRLLRLRPEGQRQVDFAVKKLLAALKEPGAPHKTYADALFDRQVDRTIAVGECCPQYSLLSDQTFAQMSDLGPNVKFIYILRDPLRRMISGVKHALRDEVGRDSVTPELVGKTVRNHLEWKNGFHKRMTSYHEVMQRLEASVRPEQIAYFFFEDLFQQDTLASICDFIDVSEMPADFDKRVNADPRPNLGVSDTLEREIVECFAHVYEAVFERFGDKVPNAWRQSINRFDTVGVADA